MKRVIFLSSLIFTLVILALATLNGAMLALAIPLVVYLAAALLYGPGGIEVTANRNLSSERVSPGTPVTVKISVTNTQGNLEKVFIEDIIPPGLEKISGESSLLTSLAPGESADIEYTISGPRGYYRFKNIRITTSDLFSINENRAEIPASGRLFIQPNVIQIGRIPIRPRATRVYSGFIPAQQGGPGIEFFGMREFQQGDPVRWINWKASARHRQSIFINQFQQERVADVGIILDTRYRSEVKTPDGHSLFEHGVLAAAALAESFLNDGNRVGLLLYGTQLDWTFPGYGKVQRERIMHSLSRAQPGESLIFGSLDHLPTRLFPPNAQLVIISPLQKDDQEMIIRLRARGYALLVISPDPVSFELKTLVDRDETTNLAVRLARLERTLMLQRLRRAGIQILDWNIDEPLHNAIHIAISRVVPQIHYQGVNL